MATDDENARAAKWQAKIIAEHEALKARTSRGGLTAEQRYNAQAADRAAGIEHGEKRGRSLDFRHARTNQRGSATLGLMLGASLIGGAIFIARGLRGRQ